jgi:hypothetical protein
LDISSRLPKQKDLLPVYAVIVIMIYGWTILKFNYNLPGWLYFLNMNEIFTIFAYSMTTNLLESVFVLSGVVIVGIIFPRKWFAETFVSRGTLLSILILGFMMFVADKFNTKAFYPGDIIRWTPAYIVLVGLVVFFAGRIRFVSRLIELFADRAIIFLYFSIPISILSLILVFIRNII